MAQISSIVHHFESFQVGNVFLHQLLSIVSLNLYFKKRTGSRAPRNFGDNVFNYLLLAFSGNIIRDVLLGNRVNIIMNTHLILAHMVIFALFQLLPSSSSRQNVFIDMVMGVFDSMAKTRLLVSGIDSAPKNSHFFVKFALGWISTQFSKYFYERFIILAASNQQFNKNCAIIFSILLFSSGIIQDYFPYKDQISLALSAIIFIGSLMDRPSGAIQAKTSKLKPGERKLRKNAKT